MKVRVSVQRTPRVEFLVGLRDRRSTTVMISDLHQRGGIIFVEHYLQSHCVDACISRLRSILIASRHRRMRVFDMSWQLAATILVIVE